MGVELQKPAGTEFALDALVIPLRLPAGYPCRLKNLDQYPTNRRSLSEQYWALGLRLIGAPIPNSAARPQQHRQCHALPTRQLRHQATLVPADAFYEWRRAETAKQPFHFGLRDDSLFDRWSHVMCGRYAYPDASN